MGGICTLKLGRTFCTEETVGPAAAAPPERPGVCGILGGAATSVLDATFSRFAVSGCGRSTSSE